MNLINVVFLAANTSRSKSYAQVMVEHGIVLKAVVAFENKEEQKPGQNDNCDKTVWEESPVLIPDLSVPLIDICKELSDDVHEVLTSNVNDDSIHELITGLAPDLVIYSGYGGQLVRKELLDSGIPFLHIHSGWLPEYRGSTTIYYSLLKNQNCGVTAILLSPEIDMGSILHRKSYPAPPFSVDIDYVYDSAIRADLLIIALKKWYENNGRFSEKKKQRAENGTTYYVIHPVLKHIALLSLENTRKE